MLDKGMTPGIYTTNYSDVARDTKIEILVQTLAERTAPRPCGPPAVFRGASIERSI